MEDHLQQQKDKSNENIKRKAEAQNKKKKQIKEYTEKEGKSLIKRLNDPAPVVLAQGSIFTSIPKPASQHEIEDRKAILEKRINAVIKRFNAITDPCHLLIIQNLKPDIHKAIERIAEQLNTIQLHLWDPQIEFEKIHLDGIEYFCQEYSKIKTANLRHTYIKVAGDIANLYQKNYLDSIEELINQFKAGSEAENQSLEEAPQASGSGTQIDITPPPTPSPSNSPISTPPVLIKPKTPPPNTQLPPFDSEFIHGLFELQDDDPIFGEFY